MESINWAAVIVAVLAGISVGQRVLAWCVRNARYVRVLADTLELMSQGGAPSGTLSAEAVKGRLDAVTKAAGGGIYEVAQAVAAAAEARADVEGSATAAARESRWRRFGRWCVRWVPIFGAFL